MTISVRYFRGNLFLLISYYFLVRNFTQLSDPRGNFLDSEQMCVYNNLERRDGKPTFALQAMSTPCLPCESISCAIVGLTSHPLWHFRLNSRDYIRDSQSTTYVSDNSFNLTSIRISEDHRSKSRRQGDTIDIVHRSTISNRESDDHVGHTFEDPKLCDTYICSRSQNWY
jgi:hypothetical protein